MFAFVPAGAISGGRRGEGTPNHHVWCVCLRVAQTFVCVISVPVECPAGEAVLFFCFQAIWAYTTAAPESLLPAKPLGTQWSVPSASVCLLQQSCCKSLHVCYIPRSLCSKEAVLLLIYQAIWACTTAAPECVLPAKPLAFVGGVCVCASVRLSQKQRSKSLHACHISRSPCCKRIFCFLLLIYQAIWARTTAAPESLLPAKPLVGLVECAKCVCVSVTPAMLPKPSCMLLFQKPLLQKRAFSFSASAHPGH